MLLDVAWGYGPFTFVIWTGFFLGILHTIMPCEDKFIFCFYAFGVSRDWKQAFRIVNFYGFGLFLTNFIIGAILSYISSIIGLTLFENLNRFLWAKQVELKKKLDAELPRTEITPTLKVSEGIKAKPDDGTA